MLNEIKEFINDGGKASAAKIIAAPQEKLNKRGNPLANSLVQKVVTYLVKLNCNYQNVVNNQLAREGKETNFVSQENWHQKEFDGFNGSIVNKKSDPNCKYLMFIVDSAKVEKYLVDGKEATEEQLTVIKAFKPAKATKPMNQGTENPIIVRTVAFENIIGIKKGEYLELKKDFE